MPAAAAQAAAGQEQAAPRALAVRQTRAAPRARAGMPPAGTHRHGRHHRRRAAPRAQAAATPAGRPGRAAPPVRVGPATGGTTGTGGTSTGGTGDTARAARRAAAAPAPAARADTAGRHDRNGRQRDRRRRRDLGGRRDGAARSDGADDRGVRHQRQLGSGPDSASLFTTSGNGLGLTILRRIAMQSCYNSGETRVSVTQGRASYDAKLIGVGLEPARQLQEPTTTRQTGGHLNDASCLRLMGDDDRQLRQPRTALRHVDRERARLRLVWLHHRPPCNGDYDTTL